MEKVENLSHNIPTTSDRIRRFSGLYYDDALSEHIVQEHAQDETVIIDSLMQAASSLLSGFRSLDLKQDTACKMYEKIASAKERVSTDQVTGADTVLPADNVAFHPDIGLGQSAAEAEVTHGPFVLNFLLFSFFAVI